uniref:Neutral ceramidase n=1 Tax=Leptocylindrus danicus TaxID=163516 RepID=A0A7S2L373_9STRA|mmetsp:Transcript_30479/g.44810  ORF Transcript_30479/g.44810 Transcript_30479/m.44810 type:complete len:426 (+) Transcript_30479:1064-2341(+)
MQQKKINGSISYRHSFIDMSNQEVTLGNGDTATTCDAALGYSFAAGTTDGPGSSTFQQGTTSGNPFWDWVKDFISEPTEEQIECQAPKPILLNTGDLTHPYLWDPVTVPISVFQIGKLFILNTPCEFTTMAGRRLREAVRNVLVDAGITDAMVTIAGLTNSYVHYVTTFEEYQAQRYEAASTLYGPHTLQAYIQNFERITRDLLRGESSVTNAAPSDLSDKQVSFLPPVILDRTELFQKFGGVRKQPKGQYSPGEEVKVSFNSANPRNNQRIEDTYLTIDRLGPDGKTWTTVFVDGDWNTKYVWELASESGVSYAHITWSIPEDQESGQYRVCHYGTRKLPFEEGEALLSYVVRLFSWNGASYAAASLFQLSSLFSFSSPDVATSSEYKEFMGCSKTFNIKNVDSASTSTSDWWAVSSFKASLWK